jgi:hypothetical protein
MTCRDSSQWLNANPAYLFNRMNNEAFTLAYKRRSMRRLMGSRTNCVCGAEIDLFGDHVLVCPRVTVRNQVRNTGHSDVSNDLRNIFLSPARLLGNTTLLTANHSWIATSNASMSQQSTQTKFIVERILR